MSDRIIRVGIVGACGRGMHFREACAARPDVRIEAVCDVNGAEVASARARLGAAHAFVNYEEMLEKVALDAVIIGTPMPLHVPQSLATLARGIHVLSEVPAGVTMEECRKLVLACRRSTGVYVMAENYCYTKQNVLVSELVGRGLFGTPYYAEGEYLHELKELNEKTPWRRKWQTGINGITYPTHSLGPILQWMPGIRVTSVCCAGSGHHHQDPRGNFYENEDSVVMLCRMTGGALAKIRVDMLSERPHAMTNYQLQGTEGCYESARAPGEADRIWLRSLGHGPNQWTPLSSLERDFLPPMWKQADETAVNAGHGGGDYFEVMDFLDAIEGKRPPACGIDAAMDMTLPGLASQKSIEEGGSWVNVPDSRDWRDERSPQLQQLRMVWPRSLLGRPPQSHLPDGYELRLFQPPDQQQYAALIERAGLGTWDAQRVEQTIRRTLPDGVFVIEHRASRALVATALCNHVPGPLHPRGGELGWVAADPAHRSKGLGSAVCAAAVRTFLARGYTEIFLLTDDFRLPAIRVYLQMGFEPLLHAPDMAERWATIRACLAAPRQRDGASTA